MALSLLLLFVAAAAACCLLLLAQLNYRRQRARRDAQLQRALQAPALVEHAWVEERQDHAALLVRLVGECAAEVARDRDIPRVALQLAAVGVHAPGWSLRAWLRRQYDSHQGGRQFAR